MRLRDIDVPDLASSPLNTVQRMHRCYRFIRAFWRFFEAPVKQYFTKVSLDAISLGRKLGFSDLIIQNLKDVPCRRLGN